MKNITITATMAIGISVVILLALGLCGCSTIAKKPADGETTTETSGNAAAAATEQPAVIPAQEQPQAAYPYMELANEPFYDDFLRVCEDTETGIDFLTNFKKTDTGYTFECSGTTVAMVVNGSKVQSMSCNDTVFYNEANKLATKPIASALLDMNKLNTTENEIAEKLAEYGQKEYDNAKMDRCSYVTNKKADGSETMTGKVEVTKAGKTENKEFVCSYKYDNGQLQIMSLTIGEDVPSAESQPEAIPQDMEKAQKENEAR